VAADKLRIGVIGAGGRGVLAANWAKSERAEVVAAADPRPEGLAELAARCGTKFAEFDDYRKLLDLDDVQAVAVTSPDWFHEEHALAALSAGKHVYCEKPLAISIEGCDRILEKVRETGLKFMIGFNMRYMGFTRVMKEIVDSGAIGEVKAAWCRHFVGHGGKFYYHDWHAESRNTTSLLLQKASHDIDVLHWICGSFTRRVVGFGALSYFGGDMPDDLTCPECDRRGKCPEDVSGKSHEGRPDRKMCAFRKCVDVPDNQALLMELESGVQVSYLQNHFTPDYWRNYTFIGTEGRVENVRAPGEENSTGPGSTLVRLWTRRTATRPEPADREYPVDEKGSGGHGGSDPRICDAFLRYVLDGERPVTSAAAGRMSVAVGCLGAESVREGGAPKDVPPLPPELAGL
jgi:predicted dehydrogenase